MIVMKSLCYSYFVLLFVILTACDKGIELGDFQPQDPYLNFLTSSLENVPEEGGEFEIELESNLPWRVKSKEDWIIVSDSTSYGNTTARSVIKLNIEKNRQLESRSGSIVAWITEDYIREFTVSQVAGSLPPIVKKNIYVKEDGQGTGDSWDDATSLVGALSKDLSAGDSIHIAAGTYSPLLSVTGGSDNVTDKTFEVKENIVIIGGYPANAKEGDIANPDDNITELTGNSQSNHVLMVTAPKVDGQKVSITGVTIKNGKALSNTSVTVNGIAYAGNYGGGIIIGNSILELNDCVIQSNMANNGAGGIYAFANAEIIMNHCVVEANSCVASGANGGGVFIDGGATLEMNGSSILNNSAGGFAGGLYVMKSVCRVFNTTVGQNSAGGTASVASGKAYGGVYIRESQGVLVNCTILGNTASNIGGGIGVYGTSSSPAAVDIVSCTVSENKVIHSSALGGGVYVNASSGAATVNVYNSIVSGNTRGVDGTNFVSDEAGASGYIITNKNSVVSATVIGEEGQEISDNFNFSTMMEKETEQIKNAIYYVLKGDDNPAKRFGMSNLELLELSTKFVPVISEEIITFDQIGLDRNGKSYMGSCVK